MSGQKINIPMLGAFLGMVAAAAAGLLSGVYTATQPAIAANLAKKTNLALEQVLPAFDNIPADETITLRSELDWPVKYYIARKEGEIVGFAGEVVTPEGFSGDMSVMVGLELDATVRTVIITANAETPGLGTVVADRKVQKTIVDLINGGEEAAGLPPNPFLDWYAGKRAGEDRWAIIKEGEDVNGKTGATITSAAVGGAVHAISWTAAAHLDQLLKGAE